MSSNHTPGRDGAGFEPDALQAQCLRTWNAADVPVREQILHATLGLVGEAGETADLLKKWAFKPGRVVGQAEVLDELSDVLYYVAVLSTLWGFTFDDMAAHLREKLADGHGWQGNEKLIEEMMSFG